jgi:hypothetical protein
MKGGGPMDDLELASVLVVVIVLALLLIFAFGQP